MCICGCVCLTLHYIETKCRARARSAAWRVAGGSAARLARRTFSCGIGGRPSYTCISRGRERNGGPGAAVMNANVMYCLRNKFPNKTHTHKFIKNIAHCKAHRRRGHAMMVVLFCRVRHTQRCRSSVTHTRPIARARNTRLDGYMDMECVGGGGPLLKLEFINDDYSGHKLSAESRCCVCVRTFPH